MDYFIFVGVIFGSHTAVEKAKLDPWDIFIMVGFYMNMVEHHNLRKPRKQYCKDVK